MVKRNVLNKLLLLRLIELSGGITGATRLQKLVFAAESNGRKLNKQTFNYRFIRWHYGPYSEELKEDIDFLVRKQFIKTDDNNTYSLSKTGKELLSKASELLDGAKYPVETAYNEYGRLKLSDLLGKIYKEFNIETDYNKGDIIFDVTNESEIGEYV